jgi:hypothetical protein
LVIVLALVVLLGAVGVGDAPASRRLQAQLVKIPAALDQTTALPLALGLPLPDAGDGIGPGSHLLMNFDGVSATYGCTANYVWSDGNRTYLGAAGHCFVPPGKTSTAGPGADWNPAGTHVRVCISGCYFGGQLGFIVTGTTADLGPVAYGRQTLNGQDVGNDFGIVVIPTALASLVRPTMPVWGGPQGVAPIDVGSALCLYGNAGGLGEVFATKARPGVGTGNDGSSWLAIIPSFQGDSGAAVDVCGVGTSAAGGILTHLVIDAGVIAGTTVSRAIAMATEAGLNIHVVNG